MQLLMSRLFQCIVRHPWWFIAFCAVLCVVCASFLVHLQKDIRSDAFLADDNPALLYRDVVREQFGLSDPLVLAIEDRREGGVYHNDTLALIQQLSDMLIDMPTINAERVLSLATQNNISHTAEGMEVTPFLEVIPETTEELAALRAQIEDFPLFHGLLVSEDAQVALIIAEAESEDLMEQAYLDAQSSVHSMSLPEQVYVHVAGEGAVNGYVAQYVDADARRLVPLAGIVITLVLIFAYGRLAPALACNAIVLCSVSMTLGLMAWQGVPFYLITNALPVILIGISVADAIHIYSHYFDLQADSDEPAEALIVQTLLAMWRPVTLTTLTTMAGFMGLYLAAYMPPFKYFGLYAALGVAIAWLYSLLLLPALMVLTRPTPGPWYLGGRGNGSTFVRLMGGLGRWTLRYYRPIVLAFTAVAVLGLYEVTQLRVDEEPIDVFHPDEPVAVADRLINAHTRGSNTLDIVIETNNEGDLLAPDRLLRIEALQSHVASLPQVGGAVSIVDYLKQMHRAMNNGNKAFYRLPDDSDLVAQYFLLYEALSGPTDFEEEIDQDYRMANIRVQIKDGGYQAIRVVVEPLQHYLDTVFNSPDMRATLSGRTNLNYHWIKDLAASHFLGLGMALALVWAVSALLFRSESAGFYTLIPVCATVLGVYVAMVALGITLGMGTSMFAAIAIGLGIDFAIHTLEKLRILVREHGDDTVAIFAAFYPGCGRALLYNCLAITGGFAVLMASKISSLNNFGSIVMLSITTSFIASVTFLPALVVWLRPGFVYSADQHDTTARWRVPVVVALVVAGALMLASTMAIADESSAEWSAGEIVDRVNSVAEGDFVTRKLKMTMTDRRGKQRVRETVTYRKTIGDEQRSVLFFTAPANVRDTAFLVWDYAEGEDDQWLYLPAARKVRRISAADRGDYFLGTDFTYEDLKLDGKLERNDFSFQLAGKVEGEQGTLLKLQATAKSDAIARELGYSRVDFLVDPQNWMVVKGDFWDFKGKHLKTLDVLDIVTVHDIITRRKMSMSNHKTGHTTLFEFTEIDYRTPVKDRFFTKTALERGL